MTKNKDKQIRELKENLNQKDDSWAIWLIVVTTLVFIFAMFVGEGSGDYTREIEKELELCNADYIENLKNQKNYTLKYECWNSFDKVHTISEDIFLTYDNFKFAKNQIIRLSVCEVIE